MADPIYPVPTLSPLGWLKGARETIDVLLAHYFEAENKQGVQYLRMETGSDLDLFVSRLKDRLSRYLGRYYAYVNLDIRRDPNDKPNDAKANILIQCDYKYDGIVYSMGAQLILGGNKMDYVINTINNG